MSSKLTRRALTALAAGTAAATAASAEAIANKLMHLEYVDRSELRELGYKAAAHIRRSTPEPAGPDPIYAVIEQYKIALDANFKAIDVSSALDSRTSEYAAANLVTLGTYEARSRAAAALFSTAPTTLAGAAALLDFLAVEVDDGENGENRLHFYSDWNDEAVHEAYSNFLPMIAAVLRRLAVQS